MTNYTPKDFTDIRGPEEKPTVPGWYPASRSGTAIEDMHKTGNLFRPDFLYWDGDYFTRWSNSDTGYVFWFGLKEKP